MANKPKQKTREPYGKVTEVGQVPVALQEISELAADGFKFVDRERAVEQLQKIDLIARSIIAVTCANPGCLSQMAEQSQTEVQ